MDCKMLEIRPAWEAYLDAITKIYNQAVIRTTATMDIAPRSVEEQKTWFDAHKDSFPILVAILNEEVIGWASLSEYSPRGGYANTAEISIYIHEDYRKKGFGKEILTEILKVGEDTGLHSIIARISAASQISLHLFENLGFAYVGTLKEVGKKFDEYRDVVIMQLIFPNK